MCSFEIPKKKHMQEYSVLLYVCVCELLNAC